MVIINIIEKENHTFIPFAVGIMGLSLIFIGDDITRQLQFLLQRISVAIGDNTEDYKCCNVFQFKDLLKLLLVLLILLF